VSRRLEEEARAWFEQDLDMHCIASPEGYFLRVNDAFLRTLGYSRKELLARPFIDFVHPDDRDRTVAEAAKLAARRGDSVDFQNRYRARDGSYRWLQWSGTLAGRGGLIYASARDITEQKVLEARLQQQAQTDPLTGLSNRRHFIEEAERTLRYIARHGSHASVLMLDLDGFKEVNDSLGHDAGDDILRQVAEALRSRLRATDLIARLGGDEFAALLPEVDPGHVDDVARSLLVEIGNRSVRRDGQLMRVTASLGIASFGPGSNDEIAELLARADRTMLTAKAAGPGEYRIAADPAVSRSATR
jgi:diguanylate cyclase (GGDEF)-like protein/PAS domain S-box-containing protein